MADNRTTLTITNPTGGTREVNVIAGSEREKRLLSQGAVSSKGMSGLEPFNYTPQSITPIPVSTLTSQDRPIEVTYQQPVSLNSTIDTYQPSNYTKTLQNTQNDLSQTESTSFEEYLKAQLEAPTKAELTNEQYTDKGIDVLDQQLSELDAQLLQEKTSLARQTEQIQTTAGLTKGQVDQQVSDLQRRSLRKQADIVIQQYALQGRYDSAKAAADRAVDALYKQGQQRLDILGAIYSRNKELFDKAEQRAFESAQADRQAQLDQEKEDRNLIYQTGLTVGQNGGSRELMQRVFNAENPQEAMVAAGQYLSDPIDKAYKQAQTASIYQNIAESKAKLSETTGTTQTAQTEIAARINDINNVLQNPYFDNAFGITGVYSGIIPGSPVLTVKSQIQQVIDTAALAARSKLKGQGTVSDFEGKMLANAQTALKFSLNADDARKELAKIRGAITTSSGGRAPVMIISPDGQTREGMASSDEITQAINNGYVVEYK